MSLPIARKKTDYPACTTRKPTDPVIFAEYIRRKNAYELDKRTLAPTLYTKMLQNAIIEGSVPVYKYGSSYFIDWEESKDYVFKGWTRKSTLLQKLTLEAGNKTSD